MGALVSGLCVLTVTGSARVWQFNAMAAACGLADAFCRPASGGIVPLPVQPGDLPAANALLAGESGWRCLQGRCWTVP